jgi:hypothetical protein
MILEDYISDTLIAADKLFFHDSLNILRILDAGCINIQSSPKKALVKPLVAHTSLDQLSHQYQTGVFILEVTFC